MRGFRVLVLALGLSVGVSACGGQAAPSPAGSRARPHPATPAAVRFLARYVTKDGRVIRLDQGGDIVSEGQAYGMLIAEAAGRPGLVRTLWSWTRDHLSRPDGLLAWHATGSGQVEDPQSATDADVLIAYALLRYTGPGQGALRRAGGRIARAVLDHEAVSLPSGAQLPVAGPWAASASPPWVNPSYLMPGVFRALGRLTGDARWSAASSAAVSMVDELTRGGAQLPPDWAQLIHGRLVPAARPGGGAGVQYGLDAARAPIWFATACRGQARELAAAWWRDVLGSDDRAAAAALTLNGTRVSSQASPVTLLAGAAAAAAAGDRSAADELGRRGQDLALRSPTYYGDAWAAMAPALLGRAIDPCRE